MSALLLLSLVAFKAEPHPTDSEVTNLVLTLKGGAKLIPADITHEAGPRGARVVRLSTADTSKLEELGKKVQPDVALAVEPADKDYYDWFLNFVPATQGGSFVPEGGATTEPAAEPVVDAKAAKAAEKAAAKAASDKAVLDKRAAIATAAAEKAAAKAAAKEATEAAKAAKAAAPAVDKAAEKAAKAAAKEAEKAEKAAAKEAAKAAAAGEEGGDESRAKHCTVGAVLKAKKNHREWGVCSYEVTVEKDGLTLTAFTGDRDLAVGTKWKNTNEMFKVLTGRERHNTVIDRFFDV